MCCLKKYILHVAYVIMKTEHGDIIVLGFTPVGIANWQTSENINVFLDNQINVTYKYKHYGN